MPNRCNRTSPLLVLHAYKVIGVADGDTLTILQGKRPIKLRLANVDAPEKPQPAQTTHCPEQNGMVERVIRTLKEQCIHRYRFGTPQHASRGRADWTGFYNTRRPHQALGMKTPAEAFASAA